ncbi:MAG: serine/threonine protein kinase, partial [Polyangiaceae bacterium]|nr:serine/threonine protein kinase [Polyangiaceae bacterium]
LVERKLPEVLARLQAPARPATDDGAVALRAELLAALDPQGRTEHGLYDQLDAALAAFATDGARAAHERGLAMFEATKGAVDALLAVESEGDGSATSAMARRTSFAVVRDLDSGLLENSILSHLLHLDNRPERVRAHEETLDKLRDRIFAFVLDREVVAPPSQESDHHVILHLARLRSLLHLLDSDAASRADDALGEAPLLRWRTAARELEAAFLRGPIPTLRRALMATFARSLDALTRASACDVSDAVLVSSGVFPTARDLATVSEASMDPDFRAVTSKLVALVRSLDVRTSSPAVVDSLLPPASTRGSEPNPFAVTLISLLALTDGLAEVGTARADALRSVLVRLHHAAHVISSTSTLRELAVAGAEADVVVGLENATHALAQIHTGARARTIGDIPEAGPAPVPTRTLSSLVSRVMASGETLDPDACAEAARSLTTGIPAALAALVTAIASKLTDLRPADNTGADIKKTEVAPAAELPPWLPPRRTLGAFYVERPLGTGGVGSVFVVTRVEDRHDQEAERFALKVPDYNENAARHLSEAQFLSHFRAEATALMALPPHPSLARFVSFDLAARPKPILVMELVEGPSLERLVDTQSLDVPKALKALGEVLDGLVAMHEVGVGHLDLKPANVVLRGGDTAVLVDFGLAGKNLRPGCGSAPYAPPEVWGAAPKEAVATPMAADVYGFACLAFELLTGDLLMEGETEVALVTSHLSHDGLPPRLREMTRDPRCVEIGELLFAALRKLPQARIGVAELKAEWDKRASRLAKSGIDWPIQ